LAQDGEKADNRALDSTSGQERMLAQMHDTLNTFGAGLIAAGALALIQSLLQPSPGLPGLFQVAVEPRRSRRARTSRVGLVLGTVSSVMGSGLVLVSGSLWPAAAALGMVACVDWIALAWLISRDYQSLVRYFEVFSGRPKNPSNNLGAYVGLAGWVEGDEWQGTWDLDEALLRARRRSSFWRALLHPVGYSDGL
jgi:hypothetical protein